MNSKYLTRTQDDIRRMALVLRAETWTLLVRESYSGKAIAWRADVPWNELCSEKNVGFLRAKNANGCDIYARPNSTQFVMLDLDKPGSMSREQFIFQSWEPLVFIETSPGKSQVWFRVSNTELPFGIATACAKIYAEKFNGDLGAADANHFGRLPGLRNKKPQYKDHPDDGGPLIKLIGCSDVSRISKFAPDIVAEGTKGAEAKRAFRLPSSSTRGGCAISIGIPGDVTYEEAIGFFDEVRNKLLRKGWSNEMLADRSAVDNQLALSLLGQGFDFKDVAAVLLQASPKAAKRGAEYVTRTVTNAAAFLDQRKKAG